MQMGVSVLISYRTSGVPFMMSQRFSHLSSHSSVIPTQTRLQTQKLLACSARTSVSTTDVLRTLSNRVGPLTNKSPPSL
uniref:Uncharacterized protein n=1 Tax=Brassica oleracea TaxID=3712 RepID=A0A3P6HDG5_BRAOL|nr:unnamed protein product [Brassica oleracea]